jgi:hypothetical protein
MRQGRQRTPQQVWSIIRIERSVAMKRAGHKTENVYRRYAMVSEADLDGAAVRLAEAASRSLSRSAASA